MTRPRRHLHRVHLYAERVHEKDVIAGPLVRLACARHLEALRASLTKAGHPRGHQFSEQKANVIIQFFERVLRLPDTLDDEGQSIPFTLTPANTFIVGSMFGWLRQDGLRQYREAYIEEGKGNAKTPMAAGIGLYGLVLDNEQAAEIYSVATGIEQARICWRDADRMVEASPELSDLVYRSVDNLAYAPTYSWFRPLTKEKRGKSGPRPHFVIFDEEHEYADAVVVNKMRAGMKRRRQPFSIGITNSGYDRTSICWQHHEHARKVLEGTIEDDRLFAYVCALDEDDDPLTDKACHVKANPNLGIIIQQEYLDRQVENARNIPSERDTVLRLNFCVWAQQYLRAIDYQAWQRCGAVPLPDPAALVGRPCFGALDLGQSDDFTAWVVIWILANGAVAVVPWFWIPESALLAYPERPYAQWRRAHLLEVTEGNTTDYDVVEAAVLADCQRHGVRTVAYDRRFAEQLAQHLIAAGVDMIDQPQGFQLTGAIRKKGELVAAGLLQHGANAIMDWMAANYIVRHGRRGELRPDKQVAADKIDGQVALDMALAAWIRAPPAPPPKQFQMIILGAHP